MKLTLKLYYSVMILTASSISISSANAKSQGGGASDALLNGPIGKGIGKLLGGMGDKGSPDNSGMSGLSSSFNGFSSGGGLSNGGLPSGGAPGATYNITNYNTDARQTVLYGPDGKEVTIDPSGKPIDANGNAVDPSKIVDANKQPVDVKAVAAASKSDAAGVSAIGNPDAAGVSAMSADDLVKQQWKSDPTLQAIDQLLYKSVPQEEADQIRQEIGKKLGVQAQVEQQKQAIAEKQQQLASEQAKAAQDAEAQKRAQTLAQEIDALEKENAKLEDLIAKAKSGQVSPDEIQGSLNGGAKGPNFDAQDDDSQFDNFAQEAPSLPKQSPANPASVNPTPGKTPPPGWKPIPVTLPASARSTAPANPAPVKTAPANTAPVKPTAPANAAPVKPTAPAAPANFDFGDFGDFNFGS